MVKKVYKTIRISQEVHKELVARKKVPQEPFEAVILRLLKGEKKPS